jgi:hypothetical protein
VPGGTTPITVVAHVAHGSFMVQTVPRGIVRGGDQRRRFGKLWFLTYMLLSALKSFAHFPAICRCLVRQVWEGWIVGIMEGSEVVIEDGVEVDEAETVENCEERRFKVGELVKFWEGALVRVNRTDSGDPAWVKADYGEGEYGVKMVTNAREKLRRVGDMEKSV